MKFARYGIAGVERPVAAIGDTWFDITSIVGDLGPETVGSLPDIAEAVAADNRLMAVDLGAHRVAAPIARPRKIIAVGLNYLDHAVESGMEVPTEPILFMKATSSICGPDDDVLRPPGSQKLDWEVELGIVVGTTSRYLVSEEAAAASIAGYVVVNDVSERAHQLERGGQWVKGKSADTFTPVGPWLVQPEDLVDVNKLNLRLWVNGRLRQNGNTSTMIFSAVECVRYISHFMTLEPGDLILTGTPPGVGLATGTYLRDGDLMELEIDQLGRQRQRCRDWAQL